MSLKSDARKQAQEVIFRKIAKRIHLKIFFNNIPVSKADSK